jgi:hypothetical protein
VDSASDDEMRELAAAGQQRQLDDMDGRLRSLSGTVAEMAAKILARPTPNQVWNWKEFNEQERAAGLADLEAWMRTTLDSVSASGPPVASLLEKSRLRPRCPNGSLWNVVTCTPRKGQFRAARLLVRPMARIFTKTASRIARGLHTEAT